MLNVIDGGSANALRERTADFDGTLLPRDRRLSALDRFVRTRSGREKPGRFWKIDLESLAPDAASIDAEAGEVRIQSPNGRAIVCDLRGAARDHAALLERAFGATLLQSTKFGALSAAFAQLGAFVYVPADVVCDEPIQIEYALPSGATAFPYTVVLAERGARATIVERISGGAGATIVGATEIVTEDGAAIDYAALQNLPSDARVLQTRFARPGRDAAIAWSVADLGAALAVGDLTVAIERTGIDANVVSLFFPTGTQHVDVVSTMSHDVGEATSQTIVKSAAAGRGQARYVGNIRIAPHAQGSDSSLRDDALLLSKTAHIDSVPALEIGANDVKAYHGATVGALDDEQIFYMESRGIARSAAERMIALGFFEPAIDRFPSQALRDEIRAALEAKLT